MKKDVKKRSDAKSTSLEFRRAFKGRRWFSVWAQSALLFNIYLNRFQNKLFVNDYTYMEVIPHMFIGSIPYFLNLLAGADEGIETFVRKKKEVSTREFN